MSEASDSAYSLAAFRAKTLGYEFEKLVTKDRNVDKSFADGKSTVRRMKLIDLNLEVALLDKPDATILNLGCGFCSRWQRFPLTRWIQVDFPSIVNKFMTLDYPKSMRFVGCDINTFDPSQHKYDIVIAEGSLTYLKLEIVERLFAAMSGHRIIFDTDNSKVHYKPLSKVPKHKYLSKFVSHGSVEYKTGSYVYSGILK